MEAISLCSSLKPSNLKQHHHQRKPSLISSTIRISCSSRSSHHHAHHHDHDNDNHKDHDHDLQAGRVVDEDMIVLRMRIHEMKIMETKKNDDQRPSNWMEWEKKYYNSSYQSDVCEAIGWLQSQLMNARPSLALGMLVLLMLSVSTSTVMVLLHSIEIAKWVFSELGFISN